MSWVSGARMSRRKFPGSMVKPASRKLCWGGPKDDAAFLLVPLPASRLAEMDGDLLSCKEGDQAFHCGRDARGSVGGLRASPVRGNFYGSRSSGRKRNVA